MRGLLFLVATLVTAQQFEVASVRKAPPITAQMLQSGLSIGKQITGNRVTINFVSMSGLLQWAFNAQPYQISGPAWIDDQRYQIEATMPPGAGEADFPAMLRDLLKERFTLNIREEQREANVYVVSQSTTGIKPKPATTPTRNAETFNSASGTMRRSTGPDGMHVEWDQMSLAQFADMVASSIGEPVLDRTGLSGTYPLSLDYPPPSPDGTQRDVLGRLMESLRDQGLRLQREKAMLNHFTVEHLDREPSDN